jgi:hypothetical protein
VAFRKKEFENENGNGKRKKKEFLAIKKFEDVEVSYINKFALETIYSALVVSFNR